MSDEFTAKETERIKEAANDLADEMGIDQLAAALSMRPVQVFALIRGGKPLPKEFAEGIARVAGITLADLRAMAAEPQVRQPPTTRVASNAPAVPAVPTTVVTANAAPALPVQTIEMPIVAQPPAPFVQPDAARGLTPTAQFAEIAREPSTTVQNPPRRKTPLIVAALVVAILGIVGSVLFFSLRHSNTPPQEATTAATPTALAADSPATTGAETPASVQGTQEAPPSTAAAAPKTTSTLPSVPTSEKGGAKPPA